MGLGGNWAVGTLYDNFTIDLVHIVYVDLLFHSTRSQDITLSEHDRIIIDKLSSFKSLNRPIVHHMVLKGMNIQSIFVVHRSIVLDNSLHNAAIFVNETSEPRSDVSKTLNDKGFPGNSGLETSFLQIERVIENVPGTVVETEPSSLVTAIDAVKS